jgi:hypothetical protein
MRKKLSMSLICLAIALTVWIVGYELLDALAISPNPTHDFSPNYIMVRGTLYYYPNPGDWDHAENPVEEIVTSFCVKNSWLLGKTNKGYFAINMETRETDYPISTVESLTEKTGFQISLDEWADDYKKRMNSPYLRRYPEVIRLAKLLNSSFWIIFAGLCFGLFVWIMRKPKIASFPKT